MRSLIVGIASSILTAGAIFAVLSLSGGPVSQPDASLPTRDVEPEFAVTVPTVDDSGHRLSMSATNRPLREVVAEAQRLSGVRIVVTDAVPDAPTSVRLANDPVEQALKRLLAPYDSYFLYGARLGPSGSAGTDARLSAILVYPRGHGQLADPGTDLFAAMLDSGMIANPEDFAAAGRERSSAAFGALSGQPSTESLLAALKDFDENVRMEALQSMLQQAPVALPDQRLRDLARHDASATLRSMALAGLVDRAQAGTADPTEVRQTLMLARADADPDVAELATRLSANLSADAELDVGEVQGAEPDPQMQGAGEPSLTQ